MVELPDVIHRGRECPCTIDFLIYNQQNTDLLEALPSGYHRVMGFNLPPWQRDAVWEDDQSQCFIESIFLGLGTGHYVVTNLEYDEAGNILKTSCLLMDGQQRLTAIQRFINNEFSIFGGIYFRDLSRTQVLTRFRQVKFPYVEVSASTPEPVLKEMYRRLNHGGTPHTCDDMARLTNNL